MYAILLALTSFGQCYPAPSYSDLVRSPGWSAPGRGVYVWAYAPTTPWNAAVAELRARGKVRSRDRSGGLPASTRRNLEDLSLTTERLYATLCRAPPDQKGALRLQWIDARAELERARLLASRQLP